MQAYVDEDQKDKGLFTFYIQQAELEERLKQEKKIKKHNPDPNPNSTPTEKKQPKVGHRNPPKPQFGPSARQILKAIPKKIDRSYKQQHSFHRQDQPSLRRDKLVELLQKHKYKHHKMKNLRVILNQSGFADEEYDYRLQSLINDERGNKESKKDQGATSKLVKKSAYYLEKYDPFKKLYLSPKNFEHDFDQPVINSNKRPVQPLKTRSQDYHLQQSRKVVEKPIDKSVQALAKSDKQANPIKNLPQHLPKLQFRCVSSINNQMKLQKLQLRSNRNKKLAEGPPDHIKSERLKHVNGSLLVESARYNAERMKLQQNRAYPVFMEIKEGRKYEEETKISKDQIYMDILRQLKFK